LALNRERAKLGPLFASIDQAKTLSERRQAFISAMDALHVCTLYEFLRRNEWNLQRLLLYLKPSARSAVPKGVVDHERDDEMREIIV
jgi:hypothetical protein